MSRSALAAGLRYLRGVVSSHSRIEDSDEQLLHAFATHRDDNAFAVLVRRHGPMVLHVCRRVLEHEQDAEDVFQAAFLVLARKAAQLRKKTALASFLHGTAYRLALSAKRAAARRRKHESGAPARPSVNAADELSWREVRTLLDEEIARLPEIYRTVFILCCLEDLSRAEAGQRLGLKEGTVSSRLAEAKHRLQRRLAQRGVELTAVLAASTLATQSASALSAVLVASLLKAASATMRGEATAGLVSASVAELALSAAPTAMRGKLVIFLALVAGAATVAAAVMPQREPPVPSGDAPRVEEPKAAAKKSADAVTVCGRVLDPEGKPVQGARLYWPRLPKNEPRSSADVENLDIAERAKSDADGRFRFELPRSDIHPDWPDISLLAAADGYGVDLVELPKEKSSHDVTLRLVKDRPIEGRIVSTEGKPLAGVNVRIMGVGKTRQERLDDFLAAWKQKERGGPDKAFGLLTGVMSLSQKEKFSQAVTDKDGRFRLQGAGVEHLVMLRLRGPGLPPALLFVINRPGFDPTSWNKALRDNTPPERRRNDPPMLLYGPKIEYVAPAGRRIEGTVREAGSGKPVPGYSISINVPNSIAINAVSDKDGKYKLLGVPKMKQYYLSALPPVNSAWLDTTARCEDAEGFRTIQVDFTAVRGILVSGRILDRSTDKGVRATVRFVPLIGNKYFGKPGYDFYEPGARTMTDRRDDGRYQLAVMPGLGMLVTQARGLSVTANGGQKLNPYRAAELDAKDHKYVKFIESDFGERYFRPALENQNETLDLLNAAKVLDLPPDAGTAQCDLYLERGTTRTLRIEDTDGKPLGGTTVAGVAFYPTTMTIKEVTCTIFALDPKKPRRLVFFHPQRNLTGTLLLRGDEKEPVVVRLGRAGSVVGRVLKGDGQPLVGADIIFSLLDETGRQLYRVAQHKPTARTDKDGRFRLEGIAPQVKFRLGIVQGQNFFSTEPDIGEKMLKLGEALDLGDIRAKPLP